MARKPYGIYSVEDRRVSSRLFRLRLKQGVWPMPDKSNGCDCCGQKIGPIERHREDYSVIAPDNIIIICYLCHRVLHMRDRMPEGWDFYREQIRLGYRYPWTKSIGRCSAVMGQKITVANRPNPLRDRTPLDDVHDGLYLLDPVEIRRARMDALYAEYEAALAETAELRLPL